MGVEESETRKRNFEVDAIYIRACVIDTRSARTGHFTHIHFIHIA